MELGEFSQSSTSPTSISHQTLLDYYCTYLVRKHGTPLETLQQTVGQDTATTQIFRSALISPNANTVNTPAGTIQHPGHLYHSGETTITSAIKLLQSNQPWTHIHHRRSLLPFLGDALSWLTGTATTKDIHSIKTSINQLITMQASQCNTLVHIVSILNITRYATQVNRHGINTLMDAVRTTSHEH